MGLSMRFDSSALDAQINKLAKAGRGDLRKGIRKGLRAAAKVAKRYAAKASPVKSGATRAALKVRSMKRSRKAIGVTVSIGAGWFKGKTFYAAFVDLGRRILKRKRKGDQSGPRVAGTHWFENSLTAANKEATEVFVEKLKEVNHDLFVKGKIEDPGE